MADEASLAAGQAALRAGRWSEARSIFEFVLSEHETAEVLLGLGEAWWWLGDPRRSVECYERGYVMCRRARDTDRAVWSAVWLALCYGADFGNPAAFSGWLGRAERMLRDAGGSQMEGWLRFVQAHDTSDLNRSRRLAEQVLETARKSGDFDLELCTLGFLGELLVAMAEVDAGLAMVDEAMAGTFGGERNRLLTAVFTCCSMIAACDLVADIERAAHWCRIADGFIQEYGCPFLHARCRTGYGNILTATGHWAEAEQELNAAIRLTRDTFPPLHATALARLGELRLNQGRLEEAELLLTPLVDSPAATIPLARLRLAKGEPAVAVALLRRRLNSLGDRWLEQASILELFVEAHLAAGERQSAAAAADRLDALADRHARPVISAQAARASGRVIAARGAANANDAMAHLEQALVEFSAVGLPLETARTRLELATLLVEREPEVAIAEARTALTAFDRLGASADADTAGALLRSLGATGRTGPKNVGVLTRRELEVLRLVAHGLSNPEIAERMCISRKTASNHVSNVLSKLGLRTRAEAAAYAARALSGITKR
ncbi:MAG: response regulator transcription factor [Gammaproteobacteria bacterium]|nr:response regulator transcription factor [Gammaproteobacteria bacterium]NIR82046.1 response regulator transcription factor [Gammaproteobacteria bacterium]NIR89274.1 response regulator transcription factor [Gammaproteobacteria bacterium]NIU03156.1 response regulator transcription factor [Gammaproteobacteria bacterium]NIV50672.1 helix-turn-helix transcriptional regulator [Gammaproteobacteria bacterium]